jgi:hypothetical protein
MNLYETLPFIIPMALALLLAWKTDKLNEKGN